MKEYLNKLTDGTYKLVVLSGVIDGHDGLIEIPEGAELYVDLGCVSAFYKKNFKQVWDQGNWMDTVYNSENLKIWNKAPILWQRHTQPEELPFVDDELNIETATGYQLDIIGQKTYGSRSRSNRKSDISYRQYLMNFIVDRKDGKSINDQYAEIEQVRQASITDTLNERQSTYGDFKDVANTTQYLLQMLSTDTMSDVQLEALHMICSKLARILMEIRIIKTIGTTSQDMPR